MIGRAVQESVGTQVRQICPASWLNVAEIELSILARQCLARRIGGAERLAVEHAAWGCPLNAEGDGWSGNPRSRTPG
ncbi:hypothetical protein TA3x_000262 [Tundrisphaera sp. TA3]|uniref:hypothetical protein n=1 Tax=Tundrisphaera sp. TA3 TaxID=3435775 RepID=UPI003EB9BE8F